MRHPPPLPGSTRDGKSDAAALLKLGIGERTENFWNINEAFQGTLVFGFTGSGNPISVDPRRQLLSGDRITALSECP